MSQDVLLSNILEYISDYTLELASVTYLYVSMENMFCHMLHFTYVNPFYSQYINCQALWMKFTIAGIFSLPDLFAPGSQLPPSLEQ